MNIREARDPAIKLVTPLNERLDRQYGVSVNLCASEDHLRSVLQHYSDKRDHLIKVLGESEAMQNSDYAKAVLISETVRLFLREIAPKRQRRAKK